MILIDFSQICISVVFQQVDHRGNLRNQDSWLLEGDGVDQSSLSPELMRHVLLNNILFFKKKFAHEFGELVFCVDSDNSWRKQMFPHYKHKRRSSKEESPVDWDMIYSFMKTFSRELAEDLGYKVMHVESAEADDIIAVLAQINHKKEKVLILSSDKDFMQLQKFPNISQYSVVKKDYLECDKPKRFLFNHIIRGDEGDGIPNIFSPLNSYYTKTRCKPCITKKIELWLDVGTPNKIQEWDEQTLKRFKQNRKLIDLDCIPQGIRDRIVLRYTEIQEKSNSRNGKPSLKQVSNFSDYFVRHGLNRLMENMADF